MNYNKTKVIEAENSIDGIDELLERVDEEEEVALSRVSSTDFINRRLLEISFQDIRKELLEIRQELISELH